jgi:hypothetical protein
MHTHVQASGPRVEAPVFAQSVWPVTEIGTALHFLYISHQNMRRVWKLTRAEKRLEMTMISTGRHAAF